MLRLPAASLGAVRRATAIKGSRSVATPPAAASNHDDHHGHHDDHGHHSHEPYIVPDHRTFDYWHTLPDLQKHVQRLEVLGLKDPWIRNYAWRYQEHVRPTWNLGIRSLFGGIHYGVFAAVSLILLTEGYSRYKAHHGQEHHDEDEHEHH